MNTRPAELAATGDYASGGDPTPQPVTVHAILGLEAWVELTSPSHYGAYEEPYLPNGWKPGTIIRCPLEALRFTDHD